MGDLALAGATSGTITLTPTAVAGSNTLTLPAATGTVMVSGNMPAFSAVQSSSQTVTLNTWTKIQLQTEEFDTANCFDNTTNYRFTPNVAGYYQISGGIQVLTNLTTILLQIYKNGSGEKYLAYTSTSTGAAYGSALIYLNGSTDYVELYGYIGATQGLTATYFQGAMVRAA